MAKEKEIKLVFSSEKYEELKAKIADYEKRERILKRVHKAKIAELDAKLEAQAVTLQGILNYAVGLKNKMLSCANKLEQSDLFVYLPEEENNKVNGIINTLRGKD